MMLSTARMAKEANTTWCRKKPRLLGMAVMGAAALPTKLAPTTRPSPAPLREEHAQRGPCPLPPAPG